MPWTPIPARPGRSSRKRIAPGLLDHLAALSIAQAGGGLMPKSAEVFTNVLAQGLQRIEAGGAFDGVSAHALSGAVIHGRKNP